MSEKTNWFCGTTPPARDGVYECNEYYQTFARYEGGVWFSQETSVADAAACQHLSPCFHPVERRARGYQWRGLTSPHGGKP